MALHRPPVLPFLLLGLASVGAAAGPGAQPPQAAVAPSAAEQRVRARVVEYWKARSTMNLASCLPFYEAPFRAQHTPESFARDFRRLNRFAPEFLGVESVALDPSGSQATVKVRLRTKVESIGGEELVAVVEEVWLLENGEWWRKAEALLPQV